MREIKFRGWFDKEIRFLEPLVYFSISPMKPGMASVTFGGHGSDIEWEQFTGLHDKNGKEIYEGDILGGSIDAPIHWCEKRMGWAFTFNGECCCYLCSGDTELSEYDLPDLEIIGNIHENPELLK